MDTEHYRQVVHSLQTKGIFETSLPKAKAKQVARNRGVGARDVPRFRVRPLKDSTTRREVARATIKEDEEDGPEEAFTLYLGNVPPNTTPRDLSFAFREYGQLENIIIPQRDGLSKGFAFI